VDNHKSPLKPPRLAAWLVTRLFPDENGFYTQLGDIDEAFNKIVQEKRYLSARIWYWMAVLRSIPYSIGRFLTWRAIMIKNYLKIAFRNIQKYKTGSLITIVGLSIGLAFCILIYLFIKDEFSFDRFHNKADSIYKIVINDHFHERAWQTGPVPMAPLLKDYFSEIENFTRLATRRNVSVKYGEKFFNETIGIIDPQFFEIFTFPLVKGNPESALISDNSVILTENSANKYFGDEDPLGKVLSLTFGDRQKSFVVVGVAANTPTNSSINFSFLIHIDNLNFITASTNTDDWESNWSASYLLLNEHADPEYIENKILATVKPYMSAYYDVRKKYGSLLESGETVTYSLQNLKDIHLNSSNIYGLRSASNTKKSYILAGIALLILCIAVINFINMSIGRSSVRAREIGVRKLLGAGRKQLIRQFWMESVCTALVSILLGLFIAVLMLPVFNSLSTKNLTVNSLFHSQGILVLLLLLVSVGVFAGSFPAMVMANFQISEILWGKFKLRRRNPFTKILIVLQFSMSAFLLVASMVMTRQIKFIENYDLGFEKDGIVVVDLQERDKDKSQEFLKLFKDNIRSHASVLGVSGCLNSPNRTELYGMIQLEGKYIDVYYNRVTYDYLKTMNMELIEGRDFSIEFATDESAVIVNQKLMDELGLEHPIGKTFRMGMETPVTIIGVVKNFHYSSLEEEVQAAALTLDPTLGLFYAVVRVSAENISNTLAFLEDTWKEIKPLRPFKYSFLDDDILSFYVDENRWNKILAYASFLTVLIACMGVFGLTLITVNNRVKEIGIRKILGASILNILKLVTREFFLLAVTANIVAWPLAWIVMNKWLQNFAYRVDFGFWPLLIPGMITASVSLIASGGYSLKAAMHNPIESLRFE
jgi:putative ABC transport system permease protein